jgi:alpha-L-fucosidase 2
LPPLQIGHRGQLQEWIEDYVEVEPDHRHTSHLYALYPGSTIDPDTTPQLAAAARKTLELRGGGMVGWPKAWRVALWARLREGEQAYIILRSLISANSWPNLFNFGPPFQIDGNFGGAAGISEMRLQSKHGEILLMPAVPGIWKNGKVEGLRVRGGATVGFEWREGKLSRAAIRGNVAASFQIRCRDRATEVRLRPGQTVTLDGNLNETTD